MKHGPTILVAIALVTRRCISSTALLYTLPSKIHAVTLGAGMKLCKLDYIPLYLRGNPLAQTPNARGFGRVRQKLSGLTPVRPRSIQSNAQVMLQSAFIGDGNGNCFPLAEQCLLIISKATGRYWKDFPNNGDDGEQLLRYFRFSPQAHRCNGPRHNNLVANGFGRSMGRIRFVRNDTCPSLTLFLFKTGPAASSSLTSQRA